MSDIVQQYLINKRKFEFNTQPTPHYRKNAPISEDLNITLIIMFDEYDIHFAKYLYYKDEYCCFNLMPESKYSCRNVKELFDLVKVYDKSVKKEEIKDKIEAFKVICSQKISTYSNERISLSEKVTGSQRALCTFKPASDDWRRVANRLNNSQMDLQRISKEIEILNGVLRSLEQI